MESLCDPPAGTAIVGVIGFILVRVVPSTLVGGSFPHLTDWSHCDHSIFLLKRKTGMVVLVVYVDDIVLSSDDLDSITEVKQYLATHFQTKDLGSLKYFLGIEFDRSKRGIILSQRKYILDMLQEYGLLGAKPIDTPMEAGYFICCGSCEPVHGKSSKVHLEAAQRILKYLKGAPGKGLLYTHNGKIDVLGYSNADYVGCKMDKRSTSDYCCFVRGNLISWKIKKQIVVPRSSAEAKYQAMAHTVAIFIANNPVFHERMKHIEVDYHFIRDELMQGKRKYVIDMLQECGFLGANPIETPMEVGHDLHDD
ncbi:uncharacterized mitochondrial protein AtMg00810-like [Aristolochia californica]|uniref:uncharacterized mitochondrial protein AtMg00810-like n=1 Tax=Aristolochia californica TaxID=171875 RepID=UPI0035E26B5C